MNSDSNPYAPPRAENDSYASRHAWRGREIVVRGGLVSSRLWMLIAYTITIDDRETFTSAQLAITEDFRWRFEHEGRMVDGHFKTTGIQHVVRKYNLTVDGENLGPAEVRLSGAWTGILIGLLILLMAIAATLYSV